MKYWSQTEVDFIKNNIDTMTNDQIAMALGRNRAQVMRKIAYLGMRRIRIHKWTEAEIAFIKSNLHLGEHGLAKAMKIPQSKISALLKRRKFKTGRKTQFLKGNVPWNVGKRYKLQSGGTFKKGMKPVNIVSIGTITTRVNRYGYLHQFIKVKEGEGNSGVLKNWEPLSRFIWKQHNGPIPNDHLIRHIDGNTMHNVIENLECISKRENRDRNSNEEKRVATLSENWMNGTRYQKDTYIAKMLAPGDPEAQQQLLALPEVIETKRQQLILNRHLKNKQYEQPYDTKRA